MLTFGSLFAGIGGFDLGFERAGMECKWQVEIDPYCQKVLAKHWPHVRRHDDVRTFPPTDADEWRVDVICGGFPCQDISYAGKGAGLAGERSGLFYEAIRIIRTLGPAIVVLENVSALLTRGIGDVLGTLASIGFDAEWHCIPAASVGAPHIRDRVFILGYSSCTASERGTGRFSKTEAGEYRTGKLNGCVPIGPEHASEGGGSGLVADPSGFSERKSADETNSEPIGGQARNELSNRRQYVSNAKRNGFNGTAIARGTCTSEAKRRLLEFEGRDWWAVEPELGRVADGISNRMDRLKGIGNAVVPQIAEWIGRRIIANTKGNLTKE